MVVVGAIAWASWVLDRGWQVAVLVLAMIMTVLVEVDVAIAGLVLVV